MGLIASTKGAIAKSFLSKLSEGDSGSTVLGGSAAALLAANIDFADLFSTDQTKLATAWGKTAAVIALALWGYYVGKPTKESKQ